ncbi:MAG: chemotaxis protein CheD [Gemmatimonadaceae bacterium]|nr:chemotaxis protein CheD [Gemmatimonadaceae bacterium]
MTKPAVRSISVRVADLAAAQGTDVQLQTVGLGSCVAIVLHDAAANVGGMAHVLLPSLAQTRDRTNPAKVAETAVPALVAEMRALGAGDPSRYTARLIGGASMFGSLLAGGGGINIGERNAIAAREALRAAGIRVVAEDVGGEHGRSVYLHCSDGRVRVRSLRMGDREL